MVGPQAETPAVLVKAPGNPAKDPCSSVKSVAQLALRVHAAKTTLDDQTSRTSLLSKGSFKTAFYLLVVDCGCRLTSSLILLRTAPASIRTSSGE